MSSITGDTRPESLISRREFHILTLAFLTLPGCKREESSHVREQTESPLIPALKEFPALSTFLRAIEEDAKTRIQNPTDVEIDSHGRRFAAALKSDLSSLGYKVPTDSTGAELLQILNQHLFDNRKSIFVPNPELLSYQVMTVTPAMALFNKTYDFGPFGKFSDNVQLCDVRGVIYDLRNIGEPLFRGATARMPARTLIILNNKSFKADSRYSITLSQDIERTVDNEIGHVHFGTYIAKNHPKLRQGHHSVLLLDEAFSFYSNLRHSPGSVLLMEIFEFLQGTINRELPKQYQAISAYLCDGMNRFIDPKLAEGPGIEIKPELYQELINECLRDAERFKQLRDHLIQHFETNLQQDLMLLDQGLSRSFASP